MQCADNKDYYEANAKELADRYEKVGTRTTHVAEAFSYTDKRDTKVLEIGCGSGRDAKEILKYTSDYIGIDISEEMIKIAREANPKGVFQNSDFLDYEIPHNFDLVIAFASLVHSNKTEVKKILEKYHNALSDGGIFYIAIYKGKYYKRHRRDNLGHRTFYYYEEDDIRGILNGFKVVRIYSEGRALGEWLNVILKKI